MSKWQLAFFLALGAVSFLISALAYVGIGYVLLSFFSSMGFMEFNL